MIKRLLSFFFVLIAFFGKAQCPQLYDYLGNLSSTPQFISCSGGAYALNIVSNSNWTSYTVDWGDGTGTASGSAYAANSTTLNHTYATATSTYPLVLTIPSLNCTLTSVVIMELQSNAGLIIPNGFPTFGCAPKTLTFQNVSTDVSANTIFTLTFGDGTPTFTYNFSSAGQYITHTYLKGSVPSCATIATLSAKNYCNFSPSFSQYGPLQIYDVDAAAISSDLIHCYPDNTFQFANSTNRNCLPQGNTFQRQEKWNSGSWNPWPPTTPFSQTFPGIGTYSVMLADSNLCGVDTTMRVVQIVPPPTAGLLAPSGNLCENTSITFTNNSTGGANVYNYNFGDAAGFSNLGAGNKSHTYTSAGTYTVTMIASIAGANNSCTDTSKVVVTILPSPIAAFTLGPSVGCNSLSVSFTNASMGAASYFWIFGNGNTSTSQNPPPENYTIPGVIVTTLIATASSGCTKSSTGSFTIRPNPIPSFVPFTTCVGSPVTFTNSSTPTSGSNSVIGVSWNFGDLSGTSPSLNPVHTYTAAGNYTVTLIANSIFCADSIKQVVNINVKPTANFVSTPTAGCPPVTITFSNTSLNAAIFSWKFLNAGTVNSTATNPSFTFSNTTQTSQLYTITLIASSGACIDSIKKTIKAWPRPVASFTSNSITGCSPMNTNFNNTSLGYSNSSWTFGDGGSSFLQNPSHTFLNTGLFTSTVITKLVITNSLSCSDSTSQLITIYPEALTAFTMVPSSGCSPLYVNFTSVPGVATYTWNHGDGTPTYTTLTAHGWSYTNTSSSDQISVVSLSVITTNGCYGTSTGSVTIFYNPIANFTLTPSSGCTPLSVTFSNTSTGNVNSKWRFDNGLTSFSPNPITSFTNATGASQFTYSPKLVVATSNNCRDSITKQVILFAQPKAMFGADTPACSPKNIQLSSSSINSNFYSWSFGDGQFSSGTNTTVSHYYVNTLGSNQAFSVKLTAVSPNLCRDSLITPIIVHPKPNFFIVSQPDSGCSPLQVIFDSIPNAKTYQWKYDGISFSSASGPVNIFENKDPITKTINIELVARDAFSCADTANKKIKIFPVPTAKFSAKPLTVFIPNQPTFFTNESTPSALTYQWKFGDGETSTEQNPSHSYSQSGEYQSILIVTNAQGCKDTFALPSKVIALDETTIEIPNAFTPNPDASPGNKFDPNDVSNDIFHPNVKGAENYNFSIYSRWGELLFDTKNPDEGWDGYYKGKLCTQDVYIWKVSASFVDGRKYNKTGDLLLLR